MIRQTTPPSTPLDTLKALVIRNISWLEYVIDALAGREGEVPEDEVLFLEFVKLQQYKALAEHLDIGVDDRLGELRVLPFEARYYRDGSPVVEYFDSTYGTSEYFPRYDGLRDEAIERHDTWVREREDRAIAEMPAGEIITGTQWGSHAPKND